MVTPDQSPGSPMLDKTFSRDPSMVFRRIADECILVPIRKNVGVYPVSESGTDRDRELRES
jgi:hypothetical protein